MTTYQLLEFLLSLTLSSYLSVCVHCQVSVKSVMNLVSETCPCNIYGEDKFDGNICFCVICALWEPASITVTGQ